MAEVRGRAVAEVRGEVRGRAVAEVRGRAVAEIRKGRDPMWLVGSSSRQGRQGSRRQASEKTRIPWGMQQR